MNVAIATWEYPPYIVGGSGIYIENIANELVNNNIGVTVFTPHMKQSISQIPQKNLHICRIPIVKFLPLKSLQFSLLLPYYFNMMNKKYKYDIIHFNSVSYWFIKPKLSNVPHIGTLHHMIKNISVYDNVIDRIFGKFLFITGESHFSLAQIEKRTIKSLDKIIAVSNFTKSEITSKYSVPDGKVEVIHNGINFKDFNNNSISNEDILFFKKMHNIPNKPILLYVGRLNDPRKGLNDLLKSFQIVMQKYDAILLVVGDGDQSKIKKVLNNLNIIDNVVLTGHLNQNDLNIAYSICDIYIVPSKLEGFGLTILEAMSAGKPIIATNVGAIPEIIINHHNGILVEPNDIDSMANAIIYYLINKSEAMNVGENNIKYVRERFSWKNSVAKLIDIYNTLTG